MCSVCDGLNVVQCVRGMEFGFLVLVQLVLVGFRLVVECMPCVWLMLAVVVYLFGEYAVNDLRCSGYRVGMKPWILNRFGGDASMWVFGC